MSTPIAMAGPYYVASAGGGQVVLERNPNYSGRRPRRTERIVYTDGITSAAAISRVERGRADYVNGYAVGYDPAGPLAPGGALDRAYGLTERGTAITAFRDRTKLLDLQTAISGDLGRKTRTPDQRLAASVGQKLALQLALSSAQPQARRRPVHE